MHSLLKLTLALAMVALLAAPAQAYEVGLRYYRIRDADLADAVDRIDDQYDEREKPLKELRREAGYNTPEHAEATAELDKLREQRDREFLKLLEQTPPEVDYRTPIEPGETVQESASAEGKPLHVELKLSRKDGNKIPLEINAEYDGTLLYKGSALLLPISSPYLVSKAFLKVQDKRQGTMFFVEVRP